MPVRPWPTRRTFLLGLAASVVFAFYGSLLPFDLREIPLAEAGRLFASIWIWPPQIWSRSDVIANVLLMMPPTFCAMAALRLDRCGVSGTVLASLAAVLGGFICAAGLEFSQIFTTDRVVSQSDVLAQTAGGAAGVAIWLGLGQTWTDWLRGAIGGAHHTSHRRLHAWLGLYAIGWFVLMALPLDLSLSPADIVHKYRAGGIVLVPFGAPYASGADLVWDVVAGILACVPLGGLAAFSVTALRRGYVNPGWTRVSVAVGAGTAFVLAGEFVQVLVAERIADITDVLSGCVGVGVGVWLAFRHVQAAPAPDTERLPSSRRSAPALVCACGWIVLLAFYHWKPFAFNTDLGQARARLAEISWMPLRQYQWEAGVQMLSQALTKSGLGVPLGLCLSPLLGSRWVNAPSATRLRWMACGAIAVLVFGLLETGQVFLPDRFPDVTDVMLGCAGTFVGFGLATLLALDAPAAGAGLDAGARAQERA
jgi:VanZ family protein